MREYEGKPVVVFAEAVIDWPEQRVQDFRVLTYAAAKARVMPDAVAGALADGKAYQMGAHARILNAGQGVRV